MVSFGEVVMYKLATEKTRRHKLDSEWDRGIIVGMSGRTTDMLVANSENVFKCRTVRRVPKEHMADPECLEKVKVSVADYFKRGARTTSQKPKIVEPIPKSPSTRETDQEEGDGSEKGEIETKRLHEAWLY